METDGSEAAKNALTILRDQASTDCPPKVTRVVNHNVISHTETDGDGTWHHFRYPVGGCYWLKAKDESKGNSGIPTSEDVEYHASVGGIRRPNIQVISMSRLPDDPRQIKDMFSVDAISGV